MQLQCKVCDRKSTASWRRRELTKLLCAKCGHPLTEPASLPHARLREIRRVAKLTQLEMAVRLGATWDTYRRLEWHPESPHAATPNLQIALRLQRVTRELGDEITPGDWYPEERD